VTQHDSPSYRGCPWGDSLQADLSRFAPYAAAIFVISFAGGLVPLVHRWSHNALQTLISLSAGIILGVLFLDLLPEIAASTPHFHVLVLAGYLALFVFEKFVFVHPHETEDLAEQRSGLAAYVSISIHSLLDGVALGSSTMLPALAPAVLFAIVAHKVPDTFSVASILTYFGFRRRKTLLFMFLFSLLTPLGGFIALLLLRDASRTMLAAPIALACGTFLFIATSDLLPHTHEHHDGRFRNLAAVFAGIAMIAIVQNLRH
jgi:zinc and cadmium transporter